MHVKRGFRVAGVTPGPKPSARIVEGVGLPKRLHLRTAQPGIPGRIRHAVRGRWGTASATRRPIPLHFDSPRLRRPSLSHARIALSLVPGEHPRTASSCPPFATGSRRAPILPPHEPRNPFRDDPVVTAMITINSTIALCPVQSQPSRQSLSSGMLAWASANATPREAAWSASPKRFTTRGDLLPPIAAVTLGEHLQG